MSTTRTSSPEILKIILHNNEAKAEDILIYDNLLAYLKKQEASLDPDVQRTTILTVLEFLKDKKLGEIAALQETIDNLKGQTKKVNSDESSLNTTPTHESLTEAPAAENQTLILHDTESMATDTTSSKTSPEIGEQDVRPLFETFLRSLTAEQQELLKQGEPDSGTEILSAKLVQDIMSLVTKYILETKGENAITSEDVRSSLGDTLHRGLAEVLNVNVQDNCDSTKILTDLIAEDVAERVNSSDTWCDRSLEPDRLTEMVRHVCCSFKAFMAKMRVVLTPRRSGHPNQDRSVESETPEKFSRGSQDNVTTPTEVVQGLIGKELGELTEPFLVVMEDSERELLQSFIDKETESFAKDDIAKSVDELVESLGAKDAASTSPESKEQVQQLWKDVAAKIRIFLAKQFAKLLAHPLAKELKNRFFCSSTVESEESVQSFSKDIGDLLLPEDIQQGGNEAVLDRLQHIFSGKDLVFTEALCDLLYLYTTKPCEIVQKH